MWARLLKGAMIAAAFSTLAACASLGGKGGAGRDTPLAAPVVTDPAPIVSGTMRPYQIRGRWYHPQEQPNYDEVGQASWYGGYHHGRPTSTGERFDMNALTAAHKTLPLPSLVEVTNRANGRRVILRVNDRGPFVDGRIIDLSRGAAEELGLLNQGVGEVRVRYVGRAPRQGGGTALRQAEAATPVQPQPPMRQAEAGPRPYYEATTAAAATNSYWVQAGAFSDRRGADRVARRLGDRAVVQNIDRDGRPLFRVVVGPWPDAGAAERARQAVVARGFDDALLIGG
ncbi:septal ring lytic transglycosylase RlpA family protein [Brevundimonas naejangsanensis]|uniref:Endolytic peptidoglycan transglycosylase RlpA n=1 Tax=Brevundimonas naejangsanensis TaxID=588932 RepID=A0A494RHP0_9CAUL|nr:septal ring lytic transglycosylase RlpA family protein [Brevundimonas naejangsanensis]AYG95891.1 septal ring lytic transglycosylase RlpA family protein [Brevundimonas naejangsanensis]